MSPSPSLKHAPLHLVSTACGRIPRLLPGADSGNPLTDTTAQPALSWQPYAAPPPLHARRELTDSTAAERWPELHPHPTRPGPHNQQSASLRHRGNESKRDRRERESRQWGAQGDSHTPSPVAGPRAPAFAAGAGEARVIVGIVVPWLLGLMVLDGRPGRVTTKPSGPDDWERPINLKRTVGVNNLSLW